MKNPKQLLIIGLVWPEPNSSAAGTRMIQIIDLFLKQDYQISFASAASESEFTFDVAVLGIKKVVIALNDSAFDVFVKSLNPSVVLFDRFIIEEQFGWRVTEQCPEAIRIIETVDLHFLRLARQKAFQEKRKFHVEDLFSDTAKREIASILKCDISLIISEDEINLLESQFKVDRKLLYYLPFLVNKIKVDTIKNWSSFEERNDFVIIGNFLHEPNWNAVQYLKESIWPLIRKQLPEVSMKVYGAYPSQKVLQLHNQKEKFLIFGRAENAHEVVQKARVLLAPIRFGAGAKGKLLEAMQCGTPTVTTTIGAESMHGDLEWNGMIADDVETIVSAAVALYQNKLLWKKAQQNGISIVNQRYEKSLFENDFMKHFVQIQNNLKQHRLENFFGALLQHHTLTSTKYMSRWIEEKNK